MSGQPGTVLIDQDGSVIVPSPHGPHDGGCGFDLLPGLIPALSRLRQAGFRLVLLTGRDGPGGERFPQPAADGARDFLIRLLAAQGVQFDARLAWPHEFAERPDGRQSAPADLETWFRAHAVDPADSCFVTDHEAYLELARSLGVAAALVRANGSPEETWEALTHRLSAGVRRATVRRQTRETDIVVELDLGRESPVAIATGIGFLDHMLEQIARHGGFALDLGCRGDLHVDEHHTVEDCALALGRALRDALGDKRGIGRYGFVLPMDESLATVAIDLSGRPYFVFEGRFGREKVGDLPTELVPHFFRSLAESLGAAIHVTVTGENTHHMVEACFKAVGRALRQAVRVEGSELPSSKGVL